MIIIYFFDSAKKRPAESEKQKIKLVWPNGCGTKSSTLFTKGVLNVLEFANPLLSLRFEFNPNVLDLFADLALNTNKLATMTTKLARSMKINVCHLPIIDQ